jgi:hypothetical protein
MLSGGKGGILLKVHLSAALGAVFRHTRPKIERGAAAGAPVKDCHLDQPQKNNDHPRNTDPINFNQQGKQHQGYTKIQTEPEEAVTFFVVQANAPFHIYLPGAFSVSSIT